MFRAVISHKDPGIANWLDAGGNQTGLMTIRYYEADSTPIPTVTRVPFSDLAKALPADAQTVTTEQRQKTLRNRARAMQRLNRD